MESHWLYTSFVVSASLVLTGVCEDQLMSLDKAGFLIGPELTWLKHVRLGGFCPQSITSPSFVTWVVYQSLNCLFQCPEVSSHTLLE